MPAPLAGIFTPNLVPLDAQGRINEDELCRYIEWLIERGIRGLYPNGSTGEFLRFTPAERQRINELVCRQAAGRVQVLCGAAEANVSECLRAAEFCAGCGARAVAIVSPFYYKLAPDSIYAYYREIAQHSPIDITLYNIPIFASPIDVATVRKLAELPRIIGIKDSSGDIAHMLRMMGAVRPIRPDFVFFTGWEAALAPMLTLGCDGAVLASSGVAPELTGAIYDAAQAGRLDESRALQLKLTALFDALLSAPEFPEGFRLGVELRGFHMGTGRQPLTDSQRGQLQGLAATLKEKLAAAGIK